MSNDNRIVLLIDTTALMPVPAVQPALAAFVNLLQLGDRFAVLGYTGRVARTYPSRGLATYDDRQVLDDATAAIEGLAADGDKSDLARALEKAGELLAADDLPKNIVLVDASEWNKGENPVEEPPAVPIETIAIGEHGQVATLKALAQKTGGQYVLCSDPAELISIFIDLVERLGIAQILAAGKRTVNSHQPYNLVGRVAAGTAVATFLVFWGDPAITYGKGTSPRFVTVEILDPAQNPVTAAPAWASGGFALFSLPAPAAGSWTVTSTFVGPGTCTFNNVVLVD